MTRLNDEIAHERRALPWRRVDSDYRFDTADGPRSLAGLFDGRRQLIVQHFMLAPGWQEGCKACSFMADHVDGMDVHLRQRDAPYKMEWLRHHDRYEPQPAPHDAVVDAACCASRT